MSHARTPRTPGLHHAAAVRAYRTLAQGLGGSAVVTALVAVVTALGSDADTVRTALLAAGVAVGTTVATAVGSFWQGVAAGLPEVDDTPVAASSVGD